MKTLAQILPLHSTFMNMSGILASYSSLPSFDGGEQYLNKWNVMLNCVWCRINLIIIYDNVFYLQTCNSMTQNTVITAIIWRRMWLCACVKVCLFWYAGVFVRICDINANNATIVKCCTVFYNDNNMEQIKKLITIIRSHVQMITIHKITDRILVIFWKLLI